MGEILYARTLHRIEASVRTWQVSGLGFAATDPGCRVRTEPPTQLILHWTGGERAAAQVHRTLCEAKNSVHFFIDAAGVIWQFADPRHVTCSHASGANTRSIGVELQSRGLQSAPSGRTTPPERESYVDQVHGEQLTFLHFTPAQRTSTIALVEYFCAQELVRRAVPEDAQGQVRRTVLDLPAAFRGVLGHYHVTRTKRDPGPAIFEQLRQHWHTALPQV